MQYCTSPTRTPRHQDVVYIFIDDVFLCQQTTVFGNGKLKTESGKLLTVNPLCVSAGDSLFELLTINY